jgi:hypothetical protein
VSGDENSMYVYVNKDENPSTICTKACPSKCKHNGRKPKESKQK